MNKEDLPECCKKCAIVPPDVDVLESVTTDNNLQSKFNKSPYPFCLVAHVIDGSATYISGICTKGTSITVKHSQRLVSSENWNY